MMQVLYIIFICIAGAAPATQRFQPVIPGLVAALAINIYRKCCIQVDFPAFTRQSVDSQSTPFQS